MIVPETKETSKGQQSKEKPSPGRTMESTTVRIPRL